jgi:hypothetical protein
MPTYVFRFKQIKFKTDEGMGEDALVENLLNSRYGNSVIDVDAPTFDDALQFAINLIKRESGFDVVDVDYELTMT